MRILYVALAWTSGILLSTADPLRAPLILLIGLALGGLIVLIRPRQGWRWLPLICALGGLRMALYPTTSDLAAFNGLGGMTLEGVVIGEPDRRDDRVQIQLAVEMVTRAGATTPITGSALIYAPPITAAHAGDRLRATGALTTPGSWDNFSYRDYLARSGVFSVMRNASIETLSRADSLSPLITLRQSAADRIAAALPEPQAGLLTGILLGSERGIAPEVADAFSVTGAAHVVAISGFNMVLVSSLVTATLRRMRVPRRLAAAISIVVIVIYTIFVGGSAAVVRAALLSILLVIGDVIRRQTFTPASLAFALILLSTHNPTVLWDVGFQLSFFAALGLATFAAPIRRRLDPALTPLIAEPLGTTLAVAAFIVPLTALHFGRLSAVMPLVNVLILPVQPLILIGGALATAFAFIAPVLAQIGYWLTMIPLSWTIEIVRLFARLPAAEVYPHPNLIAAYTASVIGVLMIAARPKWFHRLADLIRRQAVIALVGSAAILLLTAAVIVSRPDGRLHVWLLDMGGANAVLITTPGGANLLIDGGSYPSRLLTAIGDRLPFTDRALEAVILTQPDERQFGALTAVLSRYSAGAILTHGQPNLSPAYAALEQALAPFPIVNVRAGYHLDVADGVTLDVLHPADQPRLDEALDENALVVRLTYGDVSFLFTSELSREGQASLLASGVPLESAVLQLPGNALARTLDPTFLAAVNPQVILVGADANLAPDGDVLEMVEELPLFRTDQGGAIEVVSDGDQVWVSQN